MHAAGSYRFEPELLGGAPRNARVKRGDRVALWFMAVIGLVIIGAIGGFASRDLDDLEALRAHGVTRPATITDKRISHGKSDTYYLSYSLHARDVDIDDEDSVPDSLYERKREGDTLPVTFLPGKSQTHRLGRVNDRRIRWQRVMWGAGLLAAAGFFGLIVGAVLHDYRKELKLVRDGVAAVGTIETCVPPPTGAKSSDYTLSYRYPVSGGEQTATNSVSAALGKQLPAGSDVTVLYDPEDPQRSRLYRALRYTEVL